MGTAKTTPEKKQSSRTEPKPVIEPGQKRVRTVTTEERVVPDAPDQVKQPEVKVLTPHEFYIENLRKAGTIHGYTIAVYRLVNYPQDPRIDSKGRKYLGCLPWNLDGWESDVQRMYGEGAYLIEVRLNNKFDGCSFIFECDDPVDEPSALALVKHQQGNPGQPYNEVDPMEQFDRAMQLVERVLKMVGGRVAPQNPAPMPVVQPAPQQQPSAEALILKLLLSDNPKIQGLLGKVYGPAQGESSGETSGYDVLNTAIGNITSQVDWNALLPMIISKLPNVAPGQQQQQQLQPRTQQQQPANDQANPEPPAAETEVTMTDPAKITEQDVNVILDDHLINDMINNAPVDRVAGEIKTILASSLPIAGQLKPLLGMSSKTILQSLVKMSPALNQQKDNLPGHLEGWIDALKAKITEVA